MICTNQQDDNDDLQSHLSSLDDKELERICNALGCSLVRDIDGYMLRDIVSEQDVKLDNRETVNAYLANILPEMMISTELDEDQMN